MACCTARCTLVSICIFQLVFVLERTVFDSLGHMYGLVVGDGIQIIMVLVGVIGTYSYKPKYLVPYGTMQFLWLGWNAYLVCYYLEIGLLQRKEMWSWPLNLSMEAQDYFDQKLLTCNTTSTATTGTNTGYTIPAEENVPADFPMYYLLMYRDPNCLIRPLWFKLLQCALQVIFSFFAMLYVCYIVYGYEEDDDCFDFIGGFDNYNPGYPEPQQGPPKHHPGAGGYYHASAPMSHHQMSGGSGSSMMMQPLPGMHPQVMEEMANRQNYYYQRQNAHQRDNRGEIQMYVDSRA